MGLSYTCTLRDEHKTGSFTELGDPFLSLLYRISFTNPLLRPWVLPFLVPLARKTRSPWCFSCSHSHHYQTTPWLDKAVRNKQTNKEQNYPPHSVVFFMVALPGSTRFLLKFSPVIPVFYYAVLQLRSTLRENLQEKTNMGHPPWYRLLSLSFKSLSQYTCFLVLLNLHVLEFFVFCPSFLVVSTGERGFLHLGQNLDSSFHL